MDLYAEIAYNTLSCDNDIFDVVVEGVTVGSFTVEAGDTTVEAYFATSVSVSGDLDLKYIVTETVDSGCGSIYFGTGSNSLMVTGS